MRKIFPSKFRITQAFGVNAEYYKKFGLLAHEGIDIVPTGSVWDIFCLEDGVVVKDQDDPIQGKAYGKYVTIWHPAINKATQYCHLRENYVKLGQLVKREEKIGYMGATGNVTGAHLHLNVFNVDDNGIRLNKDNGYLGGIDPLPFLNEEIGTTPPSLDPTIVQQSDNWIALISHANLPNNKDIVISEWDKNANYEDIIREKDKEIEIKNQQLNDTQKKATELESSINTLHGEIKALQGNYTASQDSLNSVLLEVEQLKRDKIDLQDQLNKVKPNPEISAGELFVLWLRKIGLLK